MHVLLEQSDVFVDALASDHHAQLLFVSAYGRDTSIQQFMARLHQSSRDGGVDELTALTHYGAKQALKVLVGDPKRLEKTTGRMPRTGLLGNLVHAWIFDPAVLQVDHAARSAWLINHRTTAEIDKDALKAEAWRLVKDLSPVPLLDDWAQTTLRHVQASGGVVSPQCIGSIHAVRIELSEDFPAWVSRGVQDGLLSVPGVAKAEPGVDVARRVAA
ncbi:MAG: hypothetical protein CFE45_27215 [Burkholderiales bacterium PBB5]|nr:MAG: hypothetical protein CFE45_27215 [Burkholderiales bacterium PBB5]